MPRDAVAAAVLVALSLFFVSPVFHHMGNLGALDWDWNLFLQDAPRRTILEYHQIPLWNPYEFGGGPLLGSPWSRFLSPSFALVLSLGTVLGTKIDVWLHAVVGLWGTYLLAREQTMGRTAACVAACAYVFAGWFPMVVASGMSVLMGTIAYPWAFLALRRARHDPRFIVALGAVCAVTLFDGSAEPLAILIVALAVHEGVELAARRTTGRQVLALSLGSGLTFVGLSAIKLLPALELLRAQPRWPREIGGYSVESLLLSLLQRGQSLRTVLPEGEGFFRGTTWGIDETGAYVGVGVLLLAALGLHDRARRHPARAVSLVVFVWMAFGARARFGPWQLLHAVPPFAFMRVPERFRFVFLLDLALFAGMGLDVLRPRLMRTRFMPAFVPRRATAIAAVVAFFTVLDLVSTNRNILRDAFPIPPLATPPRSRFVQIWRMPRYDERGFLGAGQRRSQLTPFSSLYPALAVGVGSIRGFDPLRPRTGLPVHAVDRPGYLGEQWIAGTRGSVTLVRWTPNVLTLDVTSEARGVVVVNQTFFPGWRSTGGANPVSEGGLLAVSVPPGTRRVELFYRPTTFVVGAILSAASLIFVGGWFWTRWRAAGAHAER